MSVSYGSKRRSRASTLQIRRNRITALIGPSGCGKTTFLRSLNRMNDSVPGFRIEGQVLYHGHDIYGGNVDRVEVRRRIGMVFQKPNPFPKSIYDNVAWAPRNLGMKAELDERVEQALRGAALWDEVKDRLQDSALGLSGGQQQRLCIARAIAIEPDVLLLDEPASALDPIATATIEELMHSLKSRYTIVIVTHNMQQAARVADRTAFFSLDIERRRAGRDADRVRRHRDDLQPAGRPAHPRLRHRPLRLSPYVVALGAEDRVARDLLEERLAALPAVGRAAAVRRSAGAARAGRAGLLHAQDAFDLAQLGVGVLQGDRALDQHVDPDAVADRHLVDEAAQVPLQLGDPRGQLVTPALQVDDPLGPICRTQGARRFRHGPKNEPVKWPFL